MLASKKNTKLHNNCNIILQNIAQDIASNGQNDRNWHINDTTEMYNKKTMLNNGYVRKI